MTSVSNSPIVSPRNPDHDEDAIWPEIRLGDVLERVSKPVNVVADKFYQEIGIRSHGKGLFHKPIVSGKNLGNKRVFHVEPNCFVLNIVFAWEQAVARTTGRERGLIASHRFPLYRAKGDIDIDFLLWFFKTPKGKRELYLASPGGAGRNKTLNQEGFEDITIPAPSVSEQRRIADILDTWDRAIAQTEALIAAKRGLKEGLSQKIFVPAPAPEKPRESCWEACRIADLADVVGGGTPSTSEPSYWGGKIPWCTPTDLNGLPTRYVNRTERTITAAGLKASSANLLPQNSIVLCSRASVGECAINTVPMSTNQGFQSLLPYNSDDTLFLYYLMRALKRTLLRISAGSTFQEFSRSELRALEIVVPPSAKRFRIGRAFAHLDDEIDALRALRDCLHRQKRGLMQKLLTGEWRVGEMENVAEVAQ